MLGEISSSEVKEVNSLFGGFNSFYSSKREPASLYVIPNAPTMAFFGAGMALGGYGRFVRGYSFLWLGFAFIPGSIWLFTVFKRQPESTIQNAYRYLLAKRAATCELEANAGVIAEAEFA